MKIPCLKTNKYPRFSCDIYISITSVFKQTNKQTKIYRYIDNNNITRTNNIQVKSSFIVIPLHLWTYSGMKGRVSQDHGATWIQTYNNEVKQYEPIHNWPTVRFDYTYATYKCGYLYIKKNSQILYICNKRKIQAAG